MQLFKDDGFYVPSFFLVHINNKKNFDRTLLHELIHFLQDISTTFGLINISNTVNQIKDFNTIIIANKRLDSSTYKFKSYTHKVNADLFSYYIGDGSEKTKTLNSNVKVIDVTIETDLVDNFDINDIQLILGSDAMGTQSFHFGAMAIMESMAHIIETYVYGNESDFRRYPYDSVSIIVEYVYPKLNNPLAISELCEASLMYYNPADALLNILKYMKKENFYHKNNGDTYEFGISIMSLSDGTTADSVFNSYLKLIESTAAHLDDLITVEPFKSEQLGRRYITEAHQIFRQNIKTSITSIFYDRESSLTELQKHFTKIGLPLIITDNKAFTYKDTAEYYSPFLFPAIYSIFNILRQKTTKCELHEFCSKNEEYMKYDERCINIPSTRVKDDHLCPFSQIWKIWGLENIKVFNS